MKTKYLMNKISPLILLCLISIQSFPSSYEWQHSSLKDEGLNNLKIKTLSDEFRNHIVQIIEEGTGVSTSTHEGEEMTDD